ncbi:Hsp20/alpha crystallin family protein [Fundidesulfovibrio terrae]|uniref:Hsp20/alpha crystallin family protein n=1 Tax=Fundidesulfovibrio terrae TaxID=2922866 RepID=UPI001FAEF7A9|nr:Hsp20/alpha crystallin family protein [Fundidesulfovibrio terrae]
MFERFFPALRKSEPAGKFVSPFEAMERLMREPFPGFPGFSGKGDITPSLDVKETGDEILVSAELPGIDPKDVELTLDNGVLTIKGEKREETEKKEGENVLSREIRYGSFSRSMAMPGEVLADKATATFDKGVLKISIPKAEGSKSTRVSIQS